MTVSKANYVTITLYLVLLSTDDRWLQQLSLLTINWQPDRLCPCQKKFSSTSVENWLHKSRVWNSYLLMIAKYSYLLMIAKYSYLLMIAKYSYLLMIAKYSYLLMIAKYSYLLMIAKYTYLLMIAKYSYLLMIAKWANSIQGLHFVRITFNLKLLYVQCDSMREMDSHIRM